MIKNFDEFVNETVKEMIVPENRDELKKLIEDRIKTNGPNCDLNDIDVSKIVDMDELFYYSEFNGDISKWDVGNVVTMSGMFANSEFNGDISKWNVSKVDTMNSMFYKSEFNGDISKWNVSKVKHMNSMFCRSKFNGDISKWNVSCKVEQMSTIFDHSPLEKNPPVWYKKTK